jgi:hypothetical protein
VSSLAGHPRAAKLEFDAVLLALKAFDASAERFAGKAAHRVKPVQLRFVHSTGSTANFTPDLRSMGGMRLIATWASGRVLNTFAASLRPTPGNPPMDGGEIHDAWPSGAVIFTTNPDTANLRDGWKRFTQFTDRQRGCNKRVRAVPGCRASPASVKTGKCHLTPFLAPTLPSQMTLLPSRFPWRRYLCCAFRDLSGNVWR